MTININNGAALNNVLGHRTHHACKPVINKTTGDIYASATDAAEAIGASLDSVSLCCRGKLKTCKGNELEYVQHASENVDSMSSTIRKKNAEIEKLKQLVSVMEQDAAVGRAIREAKEAAKKEAEARELAIEKAAKKVERRRRMHQDSVARVQLCFGRLQDAERELEALQKGVLSA